MLGRGLLGVAIAFAAYAMIAAPASSRRDPRGGWYVARPELLRSARRALVAVAVAVAGSAGLLWYAFFTRDFSIAYVAMNTSHATKPWYTFSGLWASMEGSLLLWCLVLAVFTAIFATRRTAALQPFVPWAASVLAATQMFFLTITAGPENPFARVDVVGVDGRGLNPLLLSPGMVIHPPLLYAGLIGLGVPFAIAVASLVTRRSDWVRAVRPWILVSWLALGAGLVLGGAWAYTELGWGGYWGWDPVENAALLPWLALTAFLHSAIVEERTGMLRIWNVFLIVAAAVLATFGTFLTRSGLLSSVHTFAESPIGKWFFGFLAAQTLVGIGLLVWRLPTLRATHHMSSAVSKEAAFLANNLLFCGALLVVLWGTMLPVATEAVLGRQISVGPPFFNKVMAPIGVALLLVATFGTVAPWRRGRGRALAGRLAIPAAAALVVAAATLASTRRGDLAGLVLVATLLAATSAGEIVRRAGAHAAQPGVGPVSALAGTFARNPRRYGGYLVHLGLAVMVVGFAGSVARSQTELVVSPGERFAFAGYTFTYERLESFRAADKDVNMAHVQLARGESEVTVLRPQLNFHRNWDQPQSEIAVHVTPRQDVYLILAGLAADSSESVFRVHRNPLVLWVWVGSAIAFLGGLVALGAGRRRQRPLAARSPAQRAAPPRRAAWTS